MRFVIFILIAMIIAACQAGSQAGQGCGSVSHVCIVLAVMVWNVCHMPTFAWNQKVRMGPYFTLEAQMNFNPETQNKSVSLCVSVVDVIVIAVVIWNV
ncbi:uncharacterized protein LOC105431748 isoform X2 [Pogonomyrmex barbatus]|uniref:Uncharacterized protein LOC105431748 isoform X2 n=1 Tax=Pogonomyrmex barbatus TaxID=144034 RepID=A0A8N1S923_9HYME|nr:uncharacterized protein LOC105431748 isoform X2 [Pogonomyrmex barbatus]